jgi:fatty acid amide hydrolase
MIGPAARAAIPDSGGILGRHVVDLQLAFEVLSASASDALSLREIRVGFYEGDGYIAASAAIRRAVREAASALKDRGCQVVAFPPPDIEEAIAVYYGLFGADGGATWRAQLHGGAVDPRVQDLLTLAGMPNTARPFVAALLRVQGQPTLARTMTYGRGRSSQTDVAALVRRRDAYRARFAAAMASAGVNVLICPPSAVPAVRHGTTRQLGPASVSYTCLYNLLAYPAGVVSTSSVREDETSSRPRSREKVLDTARAIDVGSAGLPVGVQVVAGPGREDRVLAVMAALEASTARDLRRSRAP